MGTYSLIADDVVAVQFTATKYGSAVSNSDNLLIRSVVSHDPLNGRGYYVTIGGIKIFLTPGDYLVFRSGVLEEIIPEDEFEARWEIIASASTSASVSSSTSASISSSPSVSESTSPSTSISASASSSPSVSISNSPSSSTSPSTSVSNSPSVSVSGSISSSPSASVSNSISTSPSASPSSSPS